MQKDKNRKLNKIEVILRTPYSKNEIATLVVISDAVCITPVIVERILEEQIKRIVETVMLNGLYTIKNLTVYKA